MLPVGTMEQYLNRSNITAFYSKCGRLVGFDYNKTATFTRDWDYLTMTARGLVFEVSTGKLVSRAYDKFYNAHEPEVGGIHTLRQTGFESLEKADGSMISSFIYDGEIWFMTRGSFYSDQAKWAHSWARTNMNLNRITDSMSGSDLSFIYECIYPDNRIVVDYGRLEELRLTGIRNIVTGELYSYDSMVIIANMLGCGIIKRFDYETIDDVIAAVSKFTMNEEGVVLRYPDGYMVKIKSEEYCKVHRIISCVTPLAFWRAIDINTFKIPTNFLTGMPEEFREDVNELVSLTERMHATEWDRIMAIVHELPQFDPTPEGKRERFEYISTRHQKYYAQVLNYLNGKEYHIRDWIHRQIRPTGNHISGVSERLMRFLRESDE